MADSLTTLINLGLQALGEPRIMDINEPDNRAGREAALAWPVVRDEVHGEMDWNFCRERVSIPKLGTVPAFKYKFEYQEPDDSVKVWSVDETYVRFGVNLTPDVDPYGSGTEFVVEGGKIRTDKDVITDLNVVNVAGLPVTYSRRVENVVLYPVWLAPVFYYRLAMSIAEAVTGDQKIIGNVAALYGTFLKKARAQNAREGVTTRPISTFVSVRE